MTYFQMMEFKQEVEYKIKESIPKAVVKCAIYTTTYGNDDICHISISEPDIAPYFADIKIGKKSSYGFMMTDAISVAIHCIISYNKLMSFM